VSGVVVLDGMTIDSDGLAARGPATATTIDRDGNATVMDYESVYSAPAGGIMVASDVADVGWSWTQAGGFVAPSAPALAAMPVPLSISDRQFFQQLAIAGTITQAEALAAVRTGTLPPVLAGLISCMPADQQFGAEMMLSGATAFQRNNTLTNAIAALHGMTTDQIDAFFVAAGRL